MVMDVKPYDIDLVDYGASLHRPYQCFTGHWEGLCKTFDARGAFLESSSAYMNVSWTAENTWHLHEHFDNLFEVGETVFHSDIHVEGKYCHSKNDLVSITGSELTPYNYVFSIESRVIKTLAYNNHYFLDPNTRRIITHKTWGGETHISHLPDSGLHAGGEALRAVP